MFQPIVEKLPTTRDILRLSLKYFTFLTWQIVVVAVYLSAAVEYFSTNPTIVGRCIILLIVHPIVNHIVVANMKIKLGDGQHTHPFYDHMQTFAIDATMAIFQRLLIFSLRNQGSNNTDLQSLVSIPHEIIIIVLVAGVIELFSRATVDVRETCTRRLFRMPHLSEKQHIEKNNFHAASISSTQIIEVASIFVAASLTMCFSGTHRYIFHFGYEATVDFLEPMSIRTITNIAMFILIVECLVNACVTHLLEYKEIPVSEFFFHFRSKEVILIHLSSLLIGAHVMLMAFMTVPNSRICTDDTPCACPTFIMYKSPSLLCVKSNGTSVIPDIDNADDSAENIKWITIAVFAVLFALFVAGLLFVWYWRHKSSSKVQLMTVELEKERQRLNALTDVASNSLMQQSSLQQAVNTIETIIQGSPPTQAKMLEDVLKILTSPSKVKEVDFDGLLKNTDKDIADWIKNQLSGHDDARALSSRLTKMSVKKASLKEGGSDYLTNAERGGLLRATSNAVSGASTPRPSAEHRRSNTEGIKQKMETRRNSLKKENKTPSSESSHPATDDHFSNIGDESKSDSVTSESEASLAPPSLPLLSLSIKSIDSSTAAHTPEANMIEVPPESVDSSSSSWSLDLLSWEFDVFTIPGPTPLAALGWEALSLFETQSVLNVPPRPLKNVLIFLDSNYSMDTYGDNVRDSYGIHEDMIKGSSQSGSTNSARGVRTNPKNAINPYHNNLHAADVLQSVLYFLSTYSAISDDLTATEIFALLFAAYIHDFRHPGVNATYTVNSWPISGISTTFGTDSPLERHHLASAWNILRRPGFNFLDTFADEDIQHFRYIVTECVLATDLAKNMAWLTAARVSLLNTSNTTRRRKSSVDQHTDRQQLEQKLLVMQLAIKAADVGHPSKPLTLHLEWSKRISDEFYVQGDMEAAQGMKTSPFCDRTCTKLSFVQGQIGFIQFITRPLYVLLGAVCTPEEPQPWMTQLNCNISYWEKRKEELSNHETSL